MLQANRIPPRTGQNRRTLKNVNGLLQHALLAWLRDPGLGFSVWFHQQGALASVISRPGLAVPAGPVLGSLVAGLPFSWSRGPVIRTTGRAVNTYQRLTQ